jgi:hypothetical protein
MLGDVWYVLQDEEFWSVLSDRLNHELEKTTPSGAIETMLLSSFREGLTWESCAEDVMRRDGFDVDAPNVSSRAQAEIPFIKVLQILVDLAGEDAAVTKLGKGQVETSQTGE